MICVLSIAAGDPSGGAGFQQDLRVLDRLGLWGLSASTGDTIQTFTGLSESRASDPDFFARQLESAFASFPVAAIKTGAFLSPVHAEIAADGIRAYRKRCGSIVPVVCDPVLAPTRGAPFLDAEGIKGFADAMIPVASVITPNLREYEILRSLGWESPSGAGAGFGGDVDSDTDVGTCAGPDVAGVGSCGTGSDLGDAGGENACALYLKDGHGTDGRTLTEKLVLPDGSSIVVRKKRRSWRYAHGTGCAFATAVAGFLARGNSLPEACKRAARWVDRYCGELDRMHRTPGKDPRLKGL